MTQNPVLRVKVRALGARQVKNAKGGIEQAQMCKAHVWVCAWFESPYILTVEPLAMVPPSVYERNPFSFKHISI